MPVFFFLFFLFCFVLFCFVFVCVFLFCFVLSLLLCPGNNIAKVSLSDFVIQKTLLDSTTRKIKAKKNNITLILHSCSNSYCTQFTLSSKLRHRDNAYINNLIFFSFNVPCHIPCHITSVYHHNYGLWEIFQKIKAFRLSIFHVFSSCSCTLCVAFHFMRCWTVGK